MFTDVMAVVEQQVLVRAGYFYGHCRCDHEYAREPWHRPTDYAAGLMIVVELAASDFDVLAQPGLRASTTITLLTTIMQSFYVHRNDNEDMWARCVCRTLPGQPFTKFQCRKPGEISKVRYPYLASLFEAIKLLGDYAVRGILTIARG